MKIKDTLDIDRYSFDDILDKYNETKKPKFISYCFIKKNNLSLNNIMELFNMPYEKVFMFLFNIQRELDDLPIALSYEEMSKMINNEDIDQEDETFFDF